MFVFTSHTWLGKVYAIHGSSSEPLHFVPCLKYDILVECNSSRVHEISHVSILPLDSTYLTGMNEDTYE